MTAAPATRRRTTLLVFLPLILLVAAAFAANAGVNVTDRAYAVAPITVSATVAPATWSETDGCSSAMSPAVNTNQLAFSSATCNITFGITNAPADLFMVGDGSFWTQGGGFFGNTASVCNANLGLKKFGFKIASTGLTASVSGAGCTAENPAADGAANAANGTEWSAIPASATKICASATIGTKVCPLVFGVQGDTVTVPTAATYTGTLTFTAT